MRRSYDANLSQMADIAPDVGGPIAPPGAPVDNPVHNVLALCGVTSFNARQNFITIEGLDTIDAFATLSGDSDITEMAKRMASRSSVAAGKVILGTMQIKKIQALVYWVKDHHKRNLDVDPEMWTQEEVMATLQRKESEHNFEKIDVDLIDPGKCQTDFGWDAWQIAFVNKLSATLGAAKVPVVYVVREDIDNDYEFEDDDDERMHQMPLIGENFKRDNKLVYNMLKSACIKTDAWTWIQDHDRTANGRKAWKALVRHYDGTGELNKRVERAKEEIARLHYKDEKVFPFERYVTKLKENFFILSKDKDEHLTNKQRVDILMKSIKSTDGSVVAAKTSVYKDFRSDFNGATSFLSGLISSIHSAAQLDYASRHSNKRRYVSAFNSLDGRGGRGRARRGGGRFGQQSGRGGRGRDGRGRGGPGGRGQQRVRMNDVDITDPHRNFTSDEWERLGTTGRSYVLQLRNNPAGSGRGGRDAGRGAAGRSQGDTRSVSATNATNTNNNSDENSQVTAGDQLVVSALKNVGHRMDAISDAVRTPDPRMAAQLGVL